MHHPDWWKGIALEKQVELLPGHMITPGSPIQPLAPHPLDLAQEIPQRPGVSCNPVVALVPPQLKSEGLVLLRHR